MWSTRLCCKLLEQLRDQRRRNVVVRRRAGRAWPACRPARRRRSADGNRRVTPARARAPRSWSSAKSGSSVSAKPGKVPLRHRRLVAVGVSAAGVDRAEHRRRVEGLHEGARPVVDGLAGDRHVVGVHHPVHEPDEHPLRHQRRLGGDDRLEQREVRVLGLGGARDGAGRSRGRRAGAAGRCRRWSRAYWKLPTRRWLLATRASTAPGSSVSRCTWRPVATTARDAGGGDAQRVHRLADDVLAQHRADRGQAVAAARERRGARTLQVQVANGPVRADELAEQQCASVAQARDEAAELVPGVGLRHRRGTVGHRDARPGTASRPGLRSQAASRPRSAASGSLSTSSRGSGGTSACQRTAISGSSRENRSSRTTAASDAMLTSPRLRMGNLSSHLD